MRKLIKTLLFVAAVAGVASCSNDNVTPDIPEQPTTGYQLTFEGGVGIGNQARASWDDPNGSGNLVFNWEADDKGTEMVALLSDGSAFVRNYSSENSTDEDLQEALYHTYMTISPQEDLHKADFKTVRYYNKEDKEG